MINTPMLLSTPVHPHGRGDNGCMVDRLEHRNGSPPRAWGQSKPIECQLHVPRFTPTGVGTISRLRDETDKHTVHPHGRGDNLTAATQWVWANGSPPRAWGQCRRRLRTLRRVRFTPTGVGTISSSSTVICGRTVHPHGRGDNLTGRSNRGRTYGSPPRAWGQCAAADGHDERPRFTPTGVGTMANPGTMSACGTVHPHGRGDNVRRPLAGVE